MICIEVSHIYANQQWGEEQENSLQLGKELKSLNQKSRLCLLVDNYHASGSVSLPPSLKSVNIIFEKDLCLVANSLMEKLPSHLLKEEVFRKENKRILFLITPYGKIALQSIHNGKVSYTCALLSSVWHLSRANLISNPWFSEGATQLISILPQKFQEVENKVKTIIETLHPNFPLEHRFF